MAVTWDTKWRWDTEYSADSVEWCPLEEHQDVLVCGTYQLDKNDGFTDSQTNKQKRLGRIYLFVVNDQTTELNPIQTIDTSGILDQKWCCHKIQDYPVLGAVTSDGQVQLYQLTNENGRLDLKLWIEESIGRDILALSLDWSTNKMTSEQPCLVVSDSSGSITVFRVVDNGLENVGVWKGHGFEAWIAASDYWNTNVFYSGIDGGCMVLHLASPAVTCREFKIATYGHVQRDLHTQISCAGFFAMFSFTVKAIGGDDCGFKGYDVRVPDAAATTNRSHEAGVTSVRSHVDVEHQLLTGSYDERVRLWDARHLKRCVAENDVNGGVWRLKWHPFEHDTVLAACMYGGFRTLRVGEHVSVVSEYMEHGSIAYGADWKFDRKQPLVATCSFYDCRLHVSEVNNK